MPNLQILDKTLAAVFLIYGFLAKPLISKNCHNSTTSNDIDMKLGPVTKIENKNKTTLKKIDDNAMSTNYDVIVIFSIYGRFGVIRKPVSRGNIYIS